MISTDLTTLAGYFLDRHDVGIVMEPPACARVGNAILEIAARVQELEKKPVPKAQRSPVKLVAASMYEHLVCKAPPWGWGDKVTDIASKPPATEAGS